MAPGANANLAFPLMATLASPARPRDTALEPVREKVLAGQRLSFEDGVALYRDERSARPRAAGQPRARAAPRRRGVLRLEHPHQPHQRVRRPPATSAPSRRRRASRAPTRCRSTRSSTDVAALPQPVPRGAHRRRPAPRPAVRRTSPTCCRASSGVRPDIHVKAFTAVEIFFFHRLYQMSVRARSCASSRTRGSTPCPAAAPRSSPRRRATRSSRARPRASSGWT